MLQKLLKATFFFLAFFLSRNGYSQEKIGSDYLANKLNWIPSNSICKGYFQEPPDVEAYVGSMKKIDENETTIESNAPVFFQKNNWSTFSGPTKVSQPGRLVNADRIHLYQNPETGQPSILELEGNVHFYEKDKHIATNKAVFNLEKKIGTLNKSAYRIFTKTPTGFKNVIGEADQINRPNEEVLVLQNGTFTTCSPLNKVWELKSTKMVLDQKTEWGSARKIKLYFKRKKIFSFPYFSFPLSKTRKSGFLYPTTGYSTKQLGAFVGIPYYFNLAPNYDDTFTIIPNTKRILFLENEFRYLTQKSNGTFLIDLLPYDPAFQHFIKTATPSDFIRVDTDNDYIFASLNRLKHDHPSRAYVHFYNTSQINPNWKSDLHLNYVTDDYYFQDTTTRYALQNTDQLLNRLSLEYNDNHWDFAGIFQAYQTLHPVNQPMINNIYKRLPQLSLNGDWFDSKTFFNYQVQSEFVHFEFDEFARNFFYPRAYYPNNRLFAFPTGNRAHLAPSITWQKLFPAGFFKPSFQLNMTGYDLDRFQLSNTLPSHINRTLPIFNIDTGLYFNRHIYFIRKSYLQTLEPRLFYLYVPFKKQSKIPDFDTVLPPFGFSQLFRTNRFIGIDRISNANQLSVGLTSRFLDAFNGIEKLEFNLGQIFYFDPPRVFLDAQQYLFPKSPPLFLFERNFRYSPFVQELTYHLNPKWDLLFQTTWNWQQKPLKKQILEWRRWGFDEWWLYRGQQSMNNAMLEFAYRPKEDAVFNLGYEFIRNINYYNVDLRNVNRLRLSTSYPINQHWNILAGWYYNVRPNYTQNLLAGIEYNDCCWAVRFVVNRELLAQGQSEIAPQRTYNNGFFLQFQLKGLGNIGQNAGTVLTRNIPGYQNPFFGE